MADEFEDSGDGYIMDLPVGKEKKANLPVSAAATARATFASPASRKSFKSKRILDSDDESDKTSSAIIEPALTATLSDTEFQSADSDQNSVEPPAKRPRRAAAKEADDRRQAAAFLDAYLDPSSEDAVLVVESKRSGASKKRKLHRLSESSADADESKTPELNIEWDYDQLWDFAEYRDPKFGIVKEWEALVSALDFVVTLSCCVL